MKSILSGYLIQCNDETGNPINDLNRCSEVSHLLDGRFIVEMCFQAQEKRLRRSIDLFRRLKQSFIPAYSGMGGIAAQSIAFSRTPGQLTVQ